MTRVQAEIVSTPSAVTRVDAQIQATPDLAVTKVYEASTEFHFMNRHTGFNNIIQLLASHLGIRKIIE